MSSKPLVMPAVLTALWSLSILGGCSVVLAESQSESEPVATTPGLSGPRIHVERSSADLGRRFYYESLTERFQIQNVGSNDLVMNIASTSCGCVSELLSGEVLKPGESGSIDVGYNPDDKSFKYGLQNFTVEIATNDAMRPTVEFTVTAHLVRSIEVTPSIVDFGTLRSGETSTRTIDVNSYRQSYTPSISSVLLSATFLSVKELSRSESDQGVHIQYGLTLNSGDNYGEVNETLTLLTDSKEIPILEVPIRAKIPFPIRPSPPMILLGLIESGGSVTKVVRLEPEQGSHVSSLRAVCLDPRVRVALDASSAPSQWVLRSTFSAGAHQGKSKPFRSTIDLLDESDTKVGEVPIHGILVGQKR